jgi:hypothetical protein
MHILKSYHKGPLPALDPLRLLLRYGGTTTTSHRFVNRYYLAGYLALSIISTCSRSFDGYFGYSNRLSRPVNPESSIESFHPPSPTQFAVADFFSPLRSREGLREADDDTEVVWPQLLFASFLQLSDGPGLQCKMRGAKLESTC